MTTVGSNIECIVALKEFILRVVARHNIFNNSKEQIKVSKQNVQN